MDGLIHGNAAFLLEGGALLDLYGLCQKPETFPVTHSLHGGGDMRTLSELLGLTDMRRVSGSGWLLCH